MPPARVIVVGSSNTDMIVRADRLPMPGETVLGGDLTTAAGGKGANQAVAAARVGAQVTFVARVGGDMFGQQTLAAFRREGLYLDHVQQDAGTPSGVALIVVGPRGQLPRRVPGFRVQAMDSKAAGDAFNGGLAAALARGDDLEAAVRYAQAVAAISVTRPGAQPSLPMAREVEEFLAGVKT